MPPYIRVPINVVFPVYAGVIPEFTGNADDLAGFPRIRGGDPVYDGIQASQATFSPYTRG